MNTLIVDLFSDTKTRPSKPMLDAMVAAETGDEQAGEDPTTQCLQERVASLLGKESALFVPSGTMCNQIALAVQCNAGDEIIADKTSPCHFPNVFDDFLNGRQPKFKKRKKITSDWNK